MAVSHELVIIGGGPAGLTAGLYAGRARLDVIMLDPTGGGGYLNYTESIENYPGFPDGVAGPDLAELLILHATKFGLKIKTEEVTELVAAENPKRLKTPSGELRAKAVIITTGSKPMKLGVPGEEEYVGRGVSYCATCDAAFFNDQNVAVVGGGNAAIDEGLAITRHARKVFVIHRRNTLRAEKVLQERAFANEKMHFIWNTVVDRIHGDGKVTGLSIRNIETGEISELEIDGVFIFIGTRPTTEFLRGAVKTDERGYIVTGRSLETSVKGVWAAGDVQDPVYRQAITAAGQGAAAAILAEKYLQQMKW